MVLGVVCSIVTVSRTDAGYEICGVTIGFSGCFALTVEGEPIHIEISLSNQDCT